MSKERKEVLFEFMGAKIYKDTLYRVSHRIDYNAPNSWIQKGLSKAPGTGDGASCRYDQLNQRYDTGFELHSSRYLNLASGVKKSIVENLEENIVKPFLEVTGKDKSYLGAFNNETWDNYIVSFNELTSFNTADPRQAMELYICITSGKLVPKKTKHVNLEVESYFDGANYYVYSGTEDFEYNSAVTANRFESIAAFHDLAKSNTDTLAKVLVYIGTNVLSTSSKGELISVFEKFVEPDGAKIAAFGRAIKLLDSETGKLEMDIYYALKTNIIRDPKLVKKKGSISYDGYVFGTTIPEAAKKLANDKTQEGLKVIEAILLAV